jgi:L-fuconolactonase
MFAPDPVKYPFAGSYTPTTPGSVEVLRAQMDEAGVDRAFTISPWVYQWDCRYTLDSLAKHRSWLAAGVLVNPRSPDAPATLERYVRDYGVSGLRMQGRITGQGAIDDPAATALWAKAAELDLTVDVNATHEEYDMVRRRVEQFPQTRIILDHCGYVSPDLAPKEQSVAPVTDMAKYPNVYAKLSFLGIASVDGYPFADAHWMIRDIVNAFGPQRCMFGTNFPKAQYDPTCTYKQTVELFQHHLPLSDDERRWILGGTAATLWKWG